MGGRLLGWGRGSGGGLLGGVGLLLLSVTRSVLSALNIHIDWEVGMKKWTKRMD